MNFVLGINHTVFYVEPEGFEGVRRIAGTVAKDIQAVTGQLPEVTDRLTENGQVILCATLGRSPMADRLLARGVLDGERLRGRREVYQIALTEIGGNPALVKPINNGMDEQEQKGVTVPNRAARQFATMPWKRPRIFFVRSGGK